MHAHARTVAATLVAAALTATLVTAGCAPTEEPSAGLTPKIAPPAISTAGVLRAGVDLEYPPFAGTDSGREAGIDIDVASAIAAELGLTLETVQVAASDAATALADGTVDIVMSVPLAEETVLDTTLSGIYLADGPAFFAARASGAATGTVDEITVATLAGRKVGSQEGSASFWLLEYELGQGAVVSYPTLRAAFEALEAGEIDVVACDALVGAYIARDFASVGFAGVATEATALGVAVAPENAELDVAVRAALDQLAANGVLDTIRATWVGDLPELPAFGNTPSSDAEASAEETETP